MGLGSGKEERAKYYSYLRVDDVQPQHRREAPLEQFMDGFYGEVCQKGFVSENGLKGTRRQYWRR